MGSIEERHDMVGDSSLFIKSEIFTEENDDEDNCDWIQETFASESKEHKSQVEKKEEEMKILEIKIKNLSAKEVVKMKADLRKPLECGQCSKRFFKKFQLEVHIKCTHLRIKSYSCDKCGRKFIHKRNLRNHLKDHLGTRTRKFNCLKCEKTFLSIGHLIEHSNRHEGIRYECSICEKSYSDKRKTTRHQKMVHSDCPKRKLSIKTIFSGKTMRIGNTGKTRTRRTQNPFNFLGKVCPVCDKSFTRDYVLKMHLFIHMENRPRYMCDFCGKSIMSRQSLEEHVRIHTGEKPFKCDICEKTFYSKRFLKSHKQRIHDDLVKSDCKICQKTYSSKGYLEKHMKKAHSNPAVSPDDPTIIKCKFCSKILKLCEKEEHEKNVHSGQNPFKCDICWKSFEKKPNLVQHIKIHNGKPFECGDCGKSFNRKTQLNVHMMGAHEKIKSYGCDECGKKYSNARNLKNHKNAHSGIRFECDLCVRSYIAKYNLDSHKKRCHKLKKKKKN